MNVIKRHLSQKMSNITLYAHEMSPPCRAVLITAHALGLKLNIHEINLLKQDHMTKEYSKINPKQSIPAMDDNGFVLTDSHAINCYLVDKYAKDESLYPKDLQKRSLINQCLYFDAGTLFTNAKNIVKPIFQQRTNTVSKENMDRINEGFEQLNKLLEGKKWLVGDSYTLADICCVATASSATVIVNMDNYPNVKDWLQRCEKELPGYKEGNVTGVTQLHTIVRSVLSKI